MRRECALRHDRTSDRRRTRGVFGCAAWYFARLRDEWRGRGADGRDDHRVPVLRVRPLVPRPSAPGCWSRSMNLAMIAVHLPMSSTHHHGGVRTGRHGRGHQWATAADGEVRVGVLADPSCCGGTVPSGRLRAEPGPGLGATSLDCPNPRAGGLRSLLGMRGPSPTEHHATDDAAVPLRLRLADLSRPLARTGATSADAPRRVRADLDDAVEQAVALGARLADHQAQPAMWRVLIDPAGHPFCLTTVGAD